MTSDNNQKLINTLQNVSKQLTQILEQVSELVNILSENTLAENSVKSVYTDSKTTYTRDPDSMSTITDYDKRNISSYDDIAQFPVYGG